MKRICVCCLLIALLVPLFGCTAGADTQNQPAVFYYLRKELLYNQEDGVIARENRDVSGHRDDLNYLLQLYLGGPADDQLTGALPRVTRIQSLVIDGNILYILLNTGRPFSTQLQQTLGYVCLAQTCLELNSNLDEICIQNQAYPDAAPVTITRSSVEFLDITTVDTADEK